MTNSKGSLLRLALFLSCLLAAITADKNLCNNKQTCRDCIRSPNCAWCQDPAIGDENRCFTPTSNVTQCEDFTVNPKNKLEYLKNEELSQRAAGAGKAKKFVQIRPQRLRLNLRINKPYKIELQYRRAEDYPVDLYVLMDLSFSMLKHKNNLEKLSEKLSEALRNMTSDYHLGFGSFVDKTVMPFVETLPGSVPVVKNSSGVPTYSFHHHMKLDQDIEKFKTEVKKAPMSGNNDEPEGGFDALMQAMVCKKEIGWRDDARRILVFATDNTFHYAGDGRFGGIIEPNDGECHLDENGYYTEFNNQDYPSIGQINVKAKKHAINIIFAVKDKFIELYKKLADVVETSRASILSVHSNNVVQLIQQQYDAISSKIELSDNVTNIADSPIQIKYLSACKDKLVKPRSVCDEIKINEIVNFTVEILATFCPANTGDWKKIIEIQPTGMLEKLVVELNLICSCDCENEKELQSKYCSGVGTLVCGKCECDETRVGKKCECSAESKAVDEGNKYNCRPANTTEVYCKGRGICVCNQCQCHDRRYSGKYCECDDQACFTNSQREICSGKKNGECRCGTCVCNENWQGKACDCTKLTDTCLPPNGDKVCSGHGECVCGECKCENTTDGRYTGRYCEKCPTCSKRCQEIKDCVVCQMYGTGPLKDSCEQKCKAFKPTAVDDIFIDEDKNEKKCEFSDEDDCKVQFKYTEVQGDDEAGHEKENVKLIVEALRERDCRAKALVWKIVFSVIGATVLVGLLTLLFWKIATTLQDRREYMRFEKEREKARFNTCANPLYREATIETKNPTFSQ